MKKSLKKYKTYHWLRTFFKLQALPKKYLNKQTQLKITKNAQAAAAVSDLAWIPKTVNSAMVKWSLYG